MTSDRDTFAAAALTGLIVAMRDESMSEVCESAYGWADAMLRERANHDAAPAAKAVSTDDRTDKAAPSQCRDRPGDTPVTQPMPKEKRAEVSVRETQRTPPQQTTPGACSVPSEGTEPVAWDGVAKNGHPPCQDFPQKNLTLTDAEREAVEASREFWEVESEAFAEPKDQHYAATLRGLLERMK